MSQYLLHNCRLKARGVPAIHDCFYQNSVLAVNVNIYDIFSAQNQSPNLVHIFTMKFYLGKKNRSKQKFADCGPCWLCFYVRLFISPSLSLLFSSVRCLVLILSWVLLCWYLLLFSQLWHGSDPTLEITSM